MTVMFTATTQLSVQLPSPSIGEDLVEHDSTTASKSSDEATMTIGDGLCRFIRRLFTLRI